MESVRIDIHGAHDLTYPLMVGEGALFNDLPAFILDAEYAHTVIVSNDVVAPLYGEKLQALIPDSALIVVPDGEAHKTMETLKTIYSGMLKHGATRKTVLVALGGGVIGDMGGFAAASFMRGIDLIQAPTSLLAMVDASIGSKVGVDLPEGKNLAGAFKDPVAIFQDATTLNTLPEEEMQSGMAEVIKAGLIADPTLIEMLEQDSPPAIGDLIERAVQVKIKVVEEDRQEHGQRMLLNLGHTFGHAVELVSEFEVRHGEAVGIGLLAAAKLSIRLGKADNGLAIRIENILKKQGLPTHFGGGNVDKVREAMQHDKKRGAKDLKFVLLADVGSAFITDAVPPTLLEETLKEMCDDGYSGS